MAIKKAIISIAVVGLLSGCEDAGPSLNQQQAFDLKKLEMEQKHELEMKKIETIGVSTHESSWETYNQVPQAVPANVPAAIPNSPEPVDNGSSLLGTVAAVGAGALAGYAVSGLLDNGYRSYSDNSGNTRYIDSGGKEISRTQFESYRRDNPTQSKISDANQKAQAAVKTGQQKTVQAAKTVTQKVQSTVRPSKTISPAKSTSRR